MSAGRLRYLQRMQLAVLRNFARAHDEENAKVIVEEGEEDEKSGEDEIPETEEGKRLKASTLTVSATFRLSLMMVRSASGADEAFKRESCGILMDLVEGMDEETLRVFQATRAGDEIVHAVEGRSLYALGAL